MINTNKIIENEELEIASQNLPETLWIVGYLKSSLDLNYDFFLFGRDATKLDEDAIYYYNKEQEWITRYCDSQFILNDFADEFCIDFSYIPKHIQYIDMFFQKYERNKNNKYPDDCVIEFCTKEKKNMFTYYSENKNKNKNFFCGTFARVSDGWKFYPKFKEHDLDIYEILRKYNKL